MNWDILGEMIKGIFRETYKLRKCLEHRRVTRKLEVDAGMHIAFLHGDLDVELGIVEDRADRRLDRLIEFLPSYRQCKVVHLRTVCVSAFFLQSFCDALGEGQETAAAV